MNNETRTLWISLGAGVFSAFLMYSYSQEKKAEYDKNFGAQVSVVIAKEDINEMVPIDDTKVEVVTRPSSFIEPNAVTQPDIIIGYVAATPIRKGEQILMNKLLSPGSETGIALQVAPAKRAVAIPITEVTGIAKLIRPGDRVDVVAAIDVGKGATMRREVATIMTDIPVLATGQNVVNNLPRLVEAEGNSNDRISITPLTGDTKYTTITVELDPKQSQDMIYMLSTNPGAIFFTLRNPNDRQNLQRMPSSTSESVLGRPVVDLTPSAPPQSAPMPAAPPMPPPQAPRPKKAGGFKTL